MFSSIDQVSLYSGTDKHINISLEILIAQELLKYLHMFIYTFYKLLWFESFYQCFEISKWISVLVLKGFIFYSLKGKGIHQI